VKTMAIRLEDDTSAQLTMLAQLEATTVADLVRQALDSLIQTKMSNPELAAKASQVVEAIEAEASAKKQAIQSLLSPETPAPAKAKTTRRKPAEAD